MSAYGPVAACRALEKRTFANFAERPQPEVAKCAAKRTVNGASRPVAACRALKKRTFANFSLRPQTDLAANHLIASSRSKSDWEIVRPSTLARYRSAGVN